jgi:hypothetical protein
MAMTTAREQSLQKGLDLSVEALADATHLRAGDAGLRADGGHQGIDLAGGDALDPGLHDHGIQGLIDPPPWLEDRREEAAGAEFGDQEGDVAHLGGEQAWPAAVSVAAAFLAALMPIGTEHSGDLQLDQLLQAMAGLRRDARAEAPESALGMVRLVEVVLKPGKRACPPLATTGVSGAHTQPREFPPLGGTQALERWAYRDIIRALSPSPESIYGKPSTSCNSLPGMH